MNEPERARSLLLPARPAPAVLLMPLLMLAASSGAGSLPARASTLAPMLAAVPSTGRLWVLLVLLPAEGPAAASAAWPARLLQLPAWLLGALPLSLLLADAGSTRPGTMASATLPRALLLGLNFTTSLLVPVMGGTSLSYTQQTEIQQSFNTQNDPEQ